VGIERLPPLTPERFARLVQMDFSDIAYEYERRMNELQRYHPVPTGFEQMVRELAALVFYGNW
jgi:hypothetical protein